MELIDLDDYSSRELFNTSFGDVPDRIRDAFFRYQYLKDGYLTLSYTDFLAQGGWASLKFVAAEDLGSAFRIKAEISGLPVLKFRLVKAVLDDQRLKQLARLANGGPTLAVEPSPEFYCQFRLVGYLVEEALTIYAGTPYHGAVGSIALGNYALVPVLNVPGLEVDTDELYAAAAPVKTTVTEGALVTR
jgi:hypothetical protein